jgi:hypothetical protein
MKFKTLSERYLRRAHPLIKRLIGGSVDATWGPKLYGKGNTFNEWRLPTGINRLAEQTFGVD